MSSTSSTKRHCSHCSSHLLSTPYGNFYCRSVMIHTNTIGISKPYSPLSFQTSPSSHLNNTTTNSPHHHPKRPPKLSQYPLTTHSEQRASHLTAPASAQKVQTATSSPVPSHSALPHPCYNKRHFPRSYAVMVFCRVLYVGLLRFYWSISTFDLGYGVWCDLKF